MYEITIYSNRFYVDEMTLPEVNLDETILKYNKILYSVYNLLLLERRDITKYNEKLDEQSLHIYIKKKYKLDDYYANSILRLAKGKLASQEKLNKEYQKQKEASLKEVKTKLKESETKLKSYEELRTNFFKYRKDEKLYKEGKIKKEPKLKIKGIRNISVKGNVIEVRYLKQKKIEVAKYGFYSFEYEYLNKKINYLKQAIGKYKYRIQILETKIQNLKALKASIFGTKKLMKAYSTCTDSKMKEKLKTELYNKKYKNVIVTGRKDAKTGNFIFKPHYDELTNSYEMKLKLLDGKEILLKGVQIPYRNQEFLEMLNQPVPICYGLVRKVDKNQRKYYQISISFDLEQTKQINTDISTGLIGIDFNYGHLEVSDINEQGNLVNCYSIYYKTSLSSTENEQSLREVLTQVVEYATKAHKIIAIEALDTSQSKYKANRDKPKQKQLNHILHNFMYRKYLTIMHSLGMKYELLVKEVNPAFTSIIGKYKYASQKKLSPHQAASYVIARRGLNFSEHLLKEHKQLLTTEMRHNSTWSKWSYINKHF